MPAILRSSDNRTAAVERLPGLNEEEIGWRPNLDPMQYDIEHEAGGATGQFVRFDWLEARSWSQASFSPAGQIRTNTQSLNLQAGRHMQMDSHVVVSFANIDPKGKRRETQLGRASNQAPGMGSVLA